MDSFIYFEDSLIFNDNQDEKILFVRNNIAKRNDLFSIFSHGLMFPKYFGNNWDALYDCLSDLEWVAEKEILIVHHDIPFKNNLCGRKKYINVLVDVLVSWEDSLVHQLHVLFPKSCKADIELI